MNNSIIAYSIAELEKKKVLSEARFLYKSNLLSDEQWCKVQNEYKTELYSPSIIIRVLLFFFSLIGMSTIISTIGVMFGAIGESVYRVVAIILGVLLIAFTEKILIKEKNHFKSGITEAGIYTGLSFVYFGILGFGSQNMILYAVVGLLLTASVAVRYLNYIALVSAFWFLGWILFQIITGIGGIAEALMPFVFMITFGLIYWYSQKLQSKIANEIFDIQFTVIQSISLILIYIAGNYFVVRELSIKLMELKLSNQDDIPFAFLFYAFTALIPVGYIYWGIKRKSALFIRIGLLTIALSVITFKYYFSFGYPIAAVTISGGALIIVSLLLLNYLKVLRKGFTREKLLCMKWGSQDLTAIIASQTLGGNSMNDSMDQEVFEGGRFGGGGAGDNW